MEDVPAELLAPQAPVVEGHNWKIDALESDSLLQKTIATFVRGSWYPVGTARMGP